MLFSDFNLSSKIIEALFELDYETPTKIQEAAIPAVLAGKDILAGARTGTGKTAAFGLPILEKLLQKDRNKKHPQTRVLILVPTRELANQVSQNLKSYAKNLPFKIMPIFGGVSLTPQIKAFKSGLDIVVATPGRFLDLVSQDVVDTSHVDTLIFDEADRMFDMGFIHDIKKIIQILPADRQNMLFSATYPEEVRTLCSIVLNNPVKIQVDTQNSTVSQITQRVITVDRDKKHELLNEVLKIENPAQALIFTRTKRGADKCSSYLHSLGLSVAAFHGDKSQSVRSRTLDNFKRGKTQLLVATDIAARGIDIAGLPCVINLELPNVPEDYVHRIGRTGRAGNDGLAISLVCVDEFKFLRDIEKLTNQKMTRESLEGFEADLSVKPQPIRRGGNVKKEPTRDSENGNKIESRQREFRKDRGERRDRRDRDDSQRPERKGRFDDKFGDRKPRARKETSENSEFKNGDFKPKRSSKFDDKFKDKKPSFKKDDGFETGSKREFKRNVKKEFSDHSFSDEFSFDAPKKEFKRSAPKSGFKKDFSSDGEFKKSPKKEFSKDKPREFRGKRSDEKSDSKSGFKKDFKRDAKPKGEFGSKDAKKSFGKGRPKQDTPKKDFGNKRSFKKPSKKAE
ncbi:putative ATP-dependent RNA helicase [Campylobacter iguaniorum]|uniref:Putative ATP-dependent RNA helicase n=1 Tax=Campylobacter iguaniorum TaxID=1244531 RepID=A0A076FBB3_9BACT|nr:DEAD/DEAH box helicase [Campylobacter iguaniorum]AII14742.1 putative ATP-dependent RNA helicase [Campylobacter iguaniorum]